MYHNYKDKIFLKNPVLENHNLLRAFIKLIEASNTEDIKENENLIQCNVIDEIFAKYLVDINKECNREYFEFITKFVILFRECINKIKDENTLEEYSTKNNADNVPDTCNEFITDFMEGYDYFGLDTMELIEIIQHFCNWLYENKFTTSKLSLVS